VFVVAGSFSTFRRRRLASPASIHEIEATHPHVKSRVVRVTRDVQCTGATTGFLPIHPADSPGPDRLPSFGMAAVVGVFAAGFFGGWAGALAKAHALDELEHRPRRP
jgi:hypothetical protein